MRYQDPSYQLLNSPNRGGRGGRMNTLRSSPWLVLGAVLVFGGCASSQDFPTMFFEGVTGTERWSLAKFYTILAYDEYPNHDDGYCADEVAHFRDLYEIALRRHHRSKAMVIRMPNFDEVFDEHAIALGKRVFDLRARSPEGSLWWHLHLFHLRVDTYERLRTRNISLDSLGVSEEEAREMILASGNEHIEEILAGNYDGEENEYDVAREMLELGFLPRQISALLQP